MHQERKELYYDNCRYWSRGCWNNDCAELKAVLPDTQLIGRHNKTMTYFPENTSQAQNIDVVSYDNTHHSFDVIIIAVKTHQLQNVIKQLPTIAHKDSLIILAQNGYGQSQHIPHQHVYQAVVYISGQKETIKSLTFVIIAYIYKTHQILVS